MYIQLQFVLLKLTQKQTAIGFVLKVGFKLVEVMNTDIPQHSNGKVLVRLYFLPEKKPKMF